MNKKLFISILTMMAVAMTATAHDWSEPNTDGVTIYYTDVTRTYGSNAVEVSYQGKWYGEAAGEYKGTVVIPSSVTHSGKTYKVVGIGEQAFAESFELLSVTIPESIEYIRDKAFQSCCHVTEVNYNAVRCADLTLPEFAPFSFGNMAYSEYVYPEDDPDYPDRFWSAYDLRTIHIGASVERVPDYMFFGMGGELAQADYTVRPIKITYSKEGVTAINFLGVPTEIGNQAFRACRLLQSVVIPDGVKEFGQALFADCDTLSSVTLPDDMTEIPAYFFKNCKELAGFTFPSAVTSINYEAFKNCAKLTNLSNLPAGLQVIGPSAFRSCEHIANMVLPASLQTLGGYSFSDCTALTAIDIPASVAAIGNYAFEDCTNLANVTIHEGTLEIGNFVFAGCRKLSKGVVKAPAKMPRIYAQTFQGVDNTMTVEVEGGDESEYAANEYWGRFFAPQSVEETNTVSRFNNKIYNVLGAEVDANYKGIIIKNGKKYIQ